MSEMSKGAVLVYTPKGAQSDFFFFHHRFKEIADCLITFGDHEKSNVHVVIPEQVDKNMYSYRAFKMAVELANQHQLDAMLYAENDCLFSYDPRLLFEQFSPDRVLGTPTAFGKAEKSTYDWFSAMQQATPIPLKIYDNEEIPLSVYPNGALVLASTKVFKELAAAMQEGPFDYSMGIAGKLIYGDKWLEMLGVLDRSFSYFGDDGGDLGWRYNVLTQWAIAGHPFKAR